MKPKLSGDSEGVFHPEGYDNRVPRRMKLRCKKGQDVRGSRKVAEVFPCFFLSCKANARVKLAKTGYGPHSSTLVCICVVRLLFV